MKIESILYAAVALEYTQKKQNLFQAIILIPFRSIGKEQKELGLARVELTPQRLISTTIWSLSQLAEEKIIY